MDEFGAIIYSSFRYSFVKSGAPAGEEERVSGGTALSAAVPHLVSITIDGQHICGGFIYSSNWVVTAASCVVGYKCQV